MQSVEKGGVLIGAWRGYQRSPRRRHRVCCGQMWHWKGHSAAPSPPPHPCCRNTIWNKSPQLIGPIPDWAEPGHHRLPRVRYKCINLNSTRAQISLSRRTMEPRLPAGQL